MITITVNELSEILGISRSTLLYSYLSHYSLYKYVKTIKSSTGKRCQVFFFNIRKYKSFRKIFVNETV